MAKKKSDPPVVQSLSETFSIKVVQDPEMKGWLAVTVAAYPGAKSQLEFRMTPLAADALAKDLINKATHARLLAFPDDPNRCKACGKLRDALVDGECVDCRH